MIKIGNCGWSYLNAKKFFGDWKSKFKSKLQAYAKLFDLVEINSTFYNIPKISTVEKWRKEVDEINKEFEFTIKCSQIITHKSPFTGKAFWAFEKMKEIASILRAKVLLFQTPGSFKPTEKNIALAENFFKKIDREDYILVWEVRWERDWKKEIVQKLFQEIKVEQCVDPLRQDIFYAKRIFYYRLHGFGKPSMYNYSFSDEELKRILEKINKRKKTYLLFNNVTCYDDALRLKKMLSKRAC